jgi:hypothetical protein
MKKTTTTLAILLVTGSLGAFANWSSAEKGTAIGAGAGALVGGAATGSALGAAGGAAIGGVIGHEVGKNTDRR